MAQVSSILQEVSSLLQRCIQKIWLGGVGNEIFQTFGETSNISLLIFHKSRGEVNVPSPLQKVL